MSKSMKLYFNSIDKFENAMFVIDTYFDKNAYYDYNTFLNEIYIAGDEEDLKALTDLLDIYEIGFTGGRIA